MRTKYFILFLFALLKSFGQIDSSTYYEFIKYPDVDSVVFVKRTYSNHRPKEQGWIVAYKNAANSKIFQVNDAPPDQSYTLKVGIWKGFYKSGQLEFTDTIFINEIASGSIYTAFDKKGRVVLKTYGIDQKQVDKKYTKSFFQPPYENRSNMALGHKGTVIAYYPNGQIATVWHRCGQKPCGKDLYFKKDGTLKREVNNERDDK